MSCPDCFTGHNHAETPTGTTKTIHGLPTYVASPPDGITPKGVVVMITDAFGWDFENNRILCDKYAQRGGYLVYCPDFMGGHAIKFHTIQPLMKAIMTPSSWLTTLMYKPLYIVQAMYHVIPWFVRTRQSVCKPRIFSWFQSLRTSPAPFPTADLKVGAAGFCWGGKYIFLLCADPPSSRVLAHNSSILTPLLDCAFAAHPSFVSVPADVDAVTVPLSIAVGDNDMAMKGPLIQQMKEILEVKKKGDHEVNIMPGAKHGFAVREDPTDEFQSQCADKAEVQALQWFGRWLV